MKILTLFLALTISLQAATLENSRPNIVYVLTDDQGMGDLSCMGNSYLKTPNLDAFYKKSTRFTQFQVNPICTPTLAALMSGREPFAVGVSHTILCRERLVPDFVTFPQALQTAGYKNGASSTTNTSSTSPTTSCRKTTSPRNTPKSSPNSRKNTKPGGNPSKPPSPSTKA